MYSVSSAYKTAMKQPVQTFKLDGTIGTDSFTEENILSGSFSLTNQCSDGTDISVGQVYTAELKMTLMLSALQRYGVTEKVITPRFGLKLADNTFEYVPLGKFIVSKAVWGASGVEITAYDYMSKLDKTCSVSTTSGTAYAFASAACTACGVTLGTTSEQFAALPNGNVTLGLYEENEIETWRDLLSWLAQTLTCNVIANRSGEIEFRQYSQTVVDTIGTSDRFTGASFSDYETRYTGISVVNIDEKTTTYIGLPEDDALTYNCGSNPFMQYGVDHARSVREAMLNGLQMIDYVPFSVSMIGNPAYDLMDVLSFTGGLGDSTKLFCITKFVFNYNGEYQIQGVGSDPSLASARSKTDKEISALLSDTSQEMKYVAWQNTAAISVSDGQDKSVMYVNFAVNKTAWVNFIMTFCLDVETTETENGDNITCEDCNLTFTYYLGGAEITDIHPKVTFQDGQHVVTLNYFCQSAENAVETFDVWIEADGGSVSVLTAEARCVVMATGLAGTSAWDGKIYAYDNFSAINVGDVITVNFTDSATVNAQTPTTANATETFQAINIGDILNINFTDSAEVTTEEEEEETE